MDVLYTVWGFRVGDGRNEALLLVVVGGSDVIREPTGCALGTYFARGSRRIPLICEKQLPT